MSKRRLTVKCGPARRHAGKGQKRCGYKGCTHHLGHGPSVPHTWAEPGRPLKNADLRMLP